MVHHKQNCRGEFDGGVDTSPGYAQEDDKMRKLEGEAYLEGSGYLMRDWEDNLKQENKMSDLREAMTSFDAPMSIDEPEEMGMTPAGPEDLEPPMDEEPDLSHLPTRGAAFRAARNEFGPDGAFIYKGKKYNTLKAGEKPGPGSPAYVRPQGPYGHQGKESEAAFQARMRAQEERDQYQGEEMDRIEGSLYQESKQMNEEHDCAEHEGMTHEEWEKQQAQTEGADAEVQEEQEETNENWFKGNKDQLLFEILMEKWAK